MNSLRGKRILVAEDEYFIADEVVSALEGAGAVVVGPAATLAHALHLASTRTGELDGAVLDVNLNGAMVWPVLDALSAHAVPAVLATGYVAAFIPAVHATVPRCEKPVQAGDLLRVLAEEIEGAG